MNRDSLLTVRFDPVADDHAFAVSALRRELVNGTFEAVEGAASSWPVDLEGFVAVVPADFAFRHCHLPSMRRAQGPPGVAEQAFVE